MVYLRKIVDINGWGFGDAPQVLTIQESGQNTAELSATGNICGALSPVSGISDGLVFQGNGATNAGNGQANPLIDATNSTFLVRLVGLTALVLCHCLIRRNLYKHHRRSATLRLSIEKLDAASAR
jgi:hypothetical protein